MEDVFKLIAEVGIHHCLKYGNGIFYSTIQQMMAGRFKNTDEFPL